VATRHVVILGLMGSGKTSVGERVAERLDRPLIDGDARLETITDGRTAADVVEAEGLDALHRLEEHIALTALAESDPAVIGPAASVCDSAAVREALADHTVVWLSAPAAYLAARAAKKDHRPLLDTDDPVALFAGQIATREQLIVPLADLVIDRSVTSKAEAAEAIAALVGAGFDHD
jgi:shikimate kinase